MVDGELSRRRFDDVVEHPLDFAQDSTLGDVEAHNRVVHAQTDNEAVLRTSGASLLFRVSAS